MLGSLRLAAMLSLGLPVGIAAQPAGDYLMVIPAEGGEPRTLIKEPARMCGSPRWSPNGEWVAYDTTPFPYVEHCDDRLVRAVKADGSGAYTVGDGGMPSWSPDGRDLVWHTYEPSGAVVARRDGSLREWVAARWFGPVWMKTNPRHVVTLNYGVLSLGDLKTGVAEPISGASEEVFYGCSVSPDGKQVAYRNSLKQLCVVDLDHDGVERVLLKEGIASYCSWSPDGDRLVVGWSPPSNVRTRSQLYLLALQGEGEPQRIPGQESDAGNCEPNWSRDGRWIVYRRMVPPSVFKAGP